MLKYISNFWIVKKNISILYIQLNYFYLNNRFKIVGINFMFWGIL